MVHSLSAQQSGDEARPPEALAEPLSEQLRTSGKWRDWQRRHEGQGWPDGLVEAVEEWRLGRGTGCYALVAALARLGSRRGDDDNEAAMAVVVLLEAGIQRLAARLSDICSVDDVRAAVWEEVKNAEPQLGNRAPRFLLKRAQQRLLRPAAGLAKDRTGFVSLEALIEAGEEYPLTTGEAVPSGGDDAEAELADVLEWALTTGILRPADYQLLTEYVVAARVLEPRDVHKALAARHGVGERTVRRRRVALLRRLKAAVPAYLEATA